MENEELNQVETEQAEPSLEIENFDSIWGEDEEPEVREAEAEQTEAEPEEAEKSEPKQKQEAENQRFTLKVNGEEIEVDRDEVITLAQKGKDYDRIKTERDNLKADSATMTKLKGYESFLKELAESGETPMTIEQLVENTRARMLMNQDENLSEEEALKQVRANKGTEKKEPEKAEATPEERRQAMFANFLQAYPSLKAEEIPQEVWEDAGRTFDLVGAYQRHQIRELTKQNEILRQNEKNKERSTGSTKSAGSRNANQAFDALWYDDDDD